MQNFHIKSIILGTGIGIIITSIISIIYLAGANPGTAMSKEEIIQKAREYGMVSSSELLGDSGKTGEREDSQKLTADSNTAAQDGGKKEVQAESSQQKAEVQQTQASGQKVSIYVNPGDSSEIVADRLAKAGIVSDKAAFVKAIVDEGLATEINIGEFEMETGMSNEDIIRILTGK